MIIRNILHVKNERNLNAMPYLALPGLQHNNLTKNNLAFAIKTVQQ